MNNFYNTVVDLYDVNKIYYTKIWDILNKNCTWSFVDYENCINYKKVYGKIITFLNLFPECTNLIPGFLELNIFDATRRSILQLCSWNYKIKFVHGRQRIKMYFGFYHSRKFPNSSNDKSIVFEDPFYNTDDCRLQKWILDHVIDKVIFFGKQVFTMKYGEKFILINPTIRRIFESISRIQDINCTLESFLKRGKKKNSWVVCEQEWM